MIINEEMDGEESGHNVQAKKNKHRTSNLKQQDQIKLKPLVFKRSDISGELLSSDLFKNGAQTTSKFIQRDISPSQQAFD